MPANVYAAVVLSMLAVAAFTAARLAFGDLVGRARVDRFRNVFVALTMISFVVSNYWIAVALAAGAVWLFGRAEPVRPALFVAALFAMPAAEKEIPGFAGINKFIDLTPVFVVTVVALLPAMWGRANKLVDLAGLRAADRFFLGYLALACVLSFREVSATAGLRNSLDIFMTTAPMYVVFSRYDWRPAHLNALAAAFVAQFVALAAVAGLEAVTGWHHYYEINARWDVDFRRRDFERAGITRTVGPLLGSISFGATFALAILIATPLYRQMRVKLLGRAGFAALAAGLITTVSRGAWISTLIGLGAKAVVGPQGLSRLAFQSVAGFVGLIGLSFTPFGDRLLSLLPFVGSSDTDTFDYRRLLFQVGSAEVMKNPLFGSVSYLDSPSMQVLVQGQGIIDIVNAYLQIALDNGLVGLGLYLGAAGAAAGALMSEIGRANASGRSGRGLDPVLVDYARTAFACFAAFAVLIATTTLVRAQTEQLNWMIIGLCVGMARKLRVEARAPASVAVEASAEAAAAPRPSEPQSEPSRVDPSALPAHLRQYVRRPDA